ncbi:MAG: NAD-dependent DNA ligase LigA [Candidatus Magasanikbacteria bacterium]
MQKVEQHISKLRAQIDDLRYKYHVLNDPEVTDKMYEGLVDELRKIESAHPEFITPDSPTQRVATEPSKKFQKVEHVAKQWSLKDAFSKDDLEKWEERVKKLLEKKLGSIPKDLDYTCELKIDGLHIVLTYEKGILKTAATRGDGKIGEDVTQNIRTIGSVPLKLKKDIDLIAEGEVWMASSMLERINKKREKTDEQPFANPRNAAAGTIRQLDPSIVAKRRLSLTVYDISGGEIPESQEKELKDLKGLGFLTDSHWKVCRNMDYVMKMYDAWKGKLKSNPYWVDGLVIKVNKREYQDILGYTGKDPRWAIAMKFPAEQGITKVKDIYVQVGRTGALTPVALMEPVHLAGTTVTHATLHNFDEIDRLGVRVGDTVVVEKAGDIIPKVVRVLEKMRVGKEKKYRAPKKCPICHSDVVKKKILDKKQEDSAALFCENKKCYAQELRRIGHFVSKKAFNIDGMGKKIVEQLVQEGLVKNVVDIFSLTKGDLEPLERFAEKSAENLVDSIESAKDVTLARFIFGLGVRHVGEETAIALANVFGSLEKIMSASLGELTSVEDVGPRVAESLREYFDRKENQLLVSDLQKNGVKIKRLEHKVKGKKLSGKTFVITGTLQLFTRDEAKDEIREFGGSVSDSVSKKTDYVVVGENPGSKATKARDLGVKLLNESEFKKLIK